MIDTQWKSKKLLLTGSADLCSIYCGILNNALIPSTTISGKAFNKDFVAVAEILLFGGIHVV